MIASIPAIMAAPDALYLNYERADAHTPGSRMIRRKPHHGYTDRSRMLRNIRPQIAIHTTGIEAIA